MLGGIFINFKNLIFLSLFLIFLSLTSISAVELDGADSSYLHNSSFIVEYDDCTLDDAVSVENSEKNNVASSLVVEYDDCTLDDAVSVENSENNNVGVVHSQPILDFDDLQSKINDANADSTLHLYNDFINKYGSVVTINKSLTIDGHGHTINFNQHNGLKLTNGFIVIKNLIMKDAYRENGGAIYGDNDARIFIENCLFTNNRATNGGAVYNAGSNPIFILNSIFDSNSVTFYGGAVYSQGWIYLDNSRFASNYALSGGVAYTQRGVDIGNCTFIDNVAASYGGAVYADVVSMEKTPSHFIANVAYNRKGGAIYANKFGTDVYYASFINNRAGMAETDDGEAVYINKESHVTFAYCFFAGNKCSDEGGAIYLDSYKSHLTLRNNMFIDNSAGDEGQSVFNCGYYNAIENNFWGGNNPSSDNDQLIEWKATIFQKNVHHSDSNPLSIVFELAKPQVSVNETATVFIYFCNSNGSKFSGILHGLENIYFIVNGNLNEINKNITDNSVTIEFQPQIAGKYVLLSRILDHDFKRQLLNAV